MALKIVWRGGTAYAQGTVKGRRVRESLGTRDPVQAEEARAALEARLWKLGLYGDEAVRTFEDAALSYLQGGGEGRFLAPLIRHFRGWVLSSIKPGHIRDASRKLYPSASPATRRRQAITPAVAVINHAHDKGWCGAIRVKAERTKAPRRKAVDRAYIDALRAHCLSRPWAPKHLAALMLFLHQTGARLGEALSIEPQDVDLDAATAYVHETKNGESRLINLTAEIVEDLRELPPREGLVFGYVNKQGVYRALKKATAEAGLEYLGTHQPGRHSFATSLDALGFSPAEIADAGGWKSRALVAQRYTHPKDSGKRAAAALSADTKRAQSDDTPPTERPAITEKS
ncbi:tyrosine-type recombinase/integrase [Oceanicella sp. SM1341]|uniref:tyrosine-type recombinase/integrase n=1 Tax=Oceanicella sp. SM1341 TaxID=1548889 RepID=UPI000E4B4AF3|nr:tyrosine-type recombinase/integrase [Oceanicella sp. SM1341]